MSTVALPSPGPEPGRLALAGVGGWLPAVAHHRWAARLVVLAWCGVLFFHGLGTGDLYRTEALRAILAQEFLSSGNWVVPTLYGEPLLTKPPGMYAAVALVSAPFGGVTTWSARLPSALAATATVLLFHWYFRRQLGGLGGLLAALLLPASFMWLDKAGSAEIDMLQVFWVSGSILFFLRALEAEERTSEDRRSRIEDRGSRKGLAILDLRSSILDLPWWLAALLCVAGGVLTKWTAPAFFYLTAISLLWWRGQLRLLWGPRHLLSAAIAAAICLGWAALAVAQVGWQGFFDTVSQEALQRLLPHEVPVAPPRHHHRPYPWHETLAHPFIVAAAMLPWSSAAVLALWPGFGRLWDDRQRRLLQALHCWTWPNLLFWTVVPEHAPRHSFPLFPGLAGLAAMVWLAWLTGRWRWPLGRLRPGPLLAGFLLAWVLLKLTYVHAVMPARTRSREPQAKGQQIAAHVPAGSPLYLFRLKDEGIMFYYRRAHPPGTADRIVRRLPGPNVLPSTGELVYCILTGPEWEQWPGDHRSEPLLRLTDQQGDPIVLVKVLPSGHDRGGPQDWPAGVTGERGQER